MKKLGLIALAVLSLVACSKEDDPTISITSTPLTLEFEADGGSKTFNVETNQSWTLTTDGADWYTVSPESGKGNTVVTITVDSYTDAAERSSQITFSAKNLVRTVAVVQHRPDVPRDITEMSYTISSAEQEITVAAPKGFTYKVVLPEGVTVASGDENSIVLHFSENDTKADRDFEISVNTSDDIVLETISVFQSSTMLEGDLVLDEVFFTGFSIDGSDNSDSSDGDQYFKITNTTDHTVYADGLLIVMGTCSSNNSASGAFWAYPELPNSIGVETVYQIPGNGHDVAVEAGESVVLAFAAVDFEADNGAGANLTKADFEFYDENDVAPDTDNPDVPNLTNWVKASLTLSTLHNRGFESWAIAMPPADMTAETFLAEYQWVGKRTMDFKGFHFERDIEDSYTIPNEWVIDAVNGAIKENLGTLAFNATVDAGYAGVSEVDKDVTRFGKSILRKRDADGKIVDTNNSSNDFEICTPPTLK